jgi:hypothetical protein
MNYSEYKNTKPYPDKTDYEKVFIYSQGKVIGEFPAKDKDAIKKARAAHPKCLIETITQDTSYRQARNDYDTETGRLTEKFRADLFDEEGLEINDFTSRLYSIAWESGHSSGLESVANEFGELVELDRLARAVYGNKV